MKFYFTSYEINKFLKVTLFQRTETAPPLTQIFITITTTKVIKDQFMLFLFNAFF